MRSLVVLTLLVAVSTLFAQPKQPKPKEPPPIILHGMPFAVEPGKTTKLTLRGIRLDTVKSVIVQHPMATGKLIGNPKKVPLPNQVPATRVGDSEIEIELTLPKEVPGGFVPFAVVGPDGAESAPGRVMVMDDTPRIAEKEPNDSFRTAQAVPVPIVVEGKIDRNQDVDVFRIEGKAGQRLEVELQSGRWGTPVDGLLTLYDPMGRVLVVDDDALAPDPKVTATLPMDGTYLISLIDTHDLGGSSHLYRLVLR